MLFLLFILGLFLAKPAYADPIVKIVDFSSNSSPEWVEISNQTANQVDLTNWNIRDGNSSLTDDLALTGCLSPNSTQTFFHDSGWLNDGGDTIKLYDSQATLIDSLVYTAGKLNLNYQSTNTCVLTPTQTPTQTPTPIPTSTSAPLPSITPTPTPVNTNTPVPTSTLTLTPTPTNKPTTIPTATTAPWPTDTPLPELTPMNDPLPSVIVDGPPTLTPTSTPAVLSASTTSKSFASYLPLIFIVTGGVLLLIPLIITKIKK